MNGLARSGPGRVTGWLAAVVVCVVLTCGGCIGVGLSGDELSLLDAATADARLMDRTWSVRTESERADFARQNALWWQYFSDLARGRQPVPGGREVIDE